MTTFLEVRRVIWASVGVLAGACTGTGASLAMLDEDLMRFQNQKSMFDATNLMDVAQRTKLNADLKEVADMAYSAAKDASDARAKIGFYRIGATADWQRGDDRAFTGSKEGRDFCEQKTGQQDNFGLNPRDCGMFVYIPYALRSDRWSGERQDVQKRAGMDGFVAAHREAVAGLIEVYNGIGKDVPQLSAKAVPTELTERMKAQQKQVRDDVEFIVNVFVARSVGDQDKKDAVAICGNIRRDAPEIHPIQC